MIHASQLLDSLSVNVMVLDHYCHIRYLNESAQEFIQGSIKSAFDKPVFEFMRAVGEGQESRDLDSACLKCRQENTRVWLHEIEVFLPHALVSRVVDCQLTPVEEGCDDGPGILVEIRDTSSGHIEDPEPERGPMEFSFIRGLAHEIRNPLGGLRGAAQLLSVELDKPEQREFTDVIIREADRLSRLVSSMQATVSVPVLEPVNIHSVLDHVYKLVSSGPDREISVELDYDPSLPMVAGNQDALVQAFLNIVRNAVEAVTASEREGKISLVTRVDSKLLEGAASNQQVVRVDIVDNGPGIDRHIKDHVFEPLVSSKPDGTGLGLSISSDIIRNMGGRISLNSHAGGTVFSVYLKIMEEQNG